MLDGVVSFYASGIGTSATISKVMMRLASEADATYAPYSNLCPISGHTDADVTRTGKNLLENTATTSTVNGTTFTVNEDKTVTVSGTPTSNAGKAIHSGLFWDGTVAEAITSFDTLPTGMRVYCKRVAGDGTTSYPTLTASGSTLLSVYKYYDLTLQAQPSFNGSPFTVGFQVELGSTATDYQPYVGTTYPIPLGQTVYGIEVDAVEGKGLITKVIYIPTAPTKFTDDNGYFWYASIPSDKPIKGLNAGVICNRLVANPSVGATAADGLITAYATGLCRWKECGDMSQADYRTYLASNPLQICYDLATPIEVSLTPTQVELLQGENNLFSDGEMTLVYLADGNASDEEALNILLGGRYVNNHGEDEPSDREALDILLGR